MLAVYFNPDYHISSAQYPLILFLRSKPANKRINVKKYNRLKKIKSNYKEKKITDVKRKKKKRKQEENSTELQKPNIEAKVSSNSKKYD